MFLTELDENGDSVLNHNNLVVCPLCWNSRYGVEIENGELTAGEAPDYGVLPGLTASREAIGKMIFNADKILDF